MIKLFKILKCFFNGHILQIDLYSGNLFYHTNGCKICGKNITPIVNDKRNNDNKNYENILKEFYK